MDSQQLKAFLAVAHHRSFSLAAEQLFLTQPAVSKRIHQLEQQLNSPLFDRHNRSISLTESGQRLLPKARDILELMNDTQVQISNLTHSVEGTLSMATSHHIGLHRIPPFLKAFVRQYPAAQLDIRFLGSEDAYQAVEQRQVELALTTLDKRQPDKITAIPLWQDDMVCVCAPGHPLAQQQVTLASLAENAVILPEPDTITYRVVDAAFREAGLTLETRMPTNYLETIKMMVGVGLGWSVLPSSMVDEQLSVLPWPGVPMTRSLGVIHLTNRTLSNAASALISLLSNNNPDA
ncbi:MULTISPECIES: LysR family transcriptional regulator [unclassified Oceanobacter]|jgi:DNA-binding transcriptional LysR family regulator|uniref:LysR family transcriptional regulator n=1 Tax=unclassified Oceanobacter TaxID=2620260 RepID=UPI002735E3CF|nr:MULTISPECIES: LysR family transcriptional regulator [unclassified Oceanobacter]MDP2507075.1 LysR family transcriptional regulator [Oceanobacter sp. 3_MG-2023]MDP2548833.1 LysR family transcriptional regulator [Oceanobacter sp. 4_MG-2023]